MTQNASGHASGEPSNPTAQPSAKLSFYDLLGLRPNASVQDIRRAYRDLSKLYHPDTTELESAIAIPKFQALNEAYATLSSPEKRLTYDYKTGFSRISVIQPLVEEANATKANAPEKYSANAYIDPTDRPLSAGEFFALFILGVTFIGCLLLVVALSLTKGDVMATDLDILIPKEPTATEPTESAERQPFTPEFPEQPWLIPEPLTAPTLPTD